MFLCDDCHDVTQHVSLFRSFGRCEGCGKSRPCIDCHRAVCEPPRPPKATVIKKGEVEGT